VTNVEFGIYIPQIGLGYELLRDRAQLCEELGYSSFWCFDHLYGPGLPQHPALEGWTLATSLLAQTTTLRVGHMVLCATFRHPVLLGKMATTLDVISGGRYELGIGSGSVEGEHDEAGIPWGTLAERTDLLEETLAILTSMFANETTTFSGKHFEVRNFPNMPRPVQQPGPRLWVGGAGERRTLPLVARYADVWNCPTYALGDLDAKRAVLVRECERVGRDPATIVLSLEAVLALAPNAGALDDVRALADRRFAGPGWRLHEGGFVGTPEQVTGRIQGLVDDGFRHFVFFTHDRGDPATLHLFANEVMPAFG